MSTERLSFGFNSLIPETYKTKAEAFAKCLQHKLLSLGRIESTSGAYSGEKRRLSGEQEQEKPFYRNESPRRKSGGGLETSSKPGKTDESDEEFVSHSESENGGDWTIRSRKPKLTSMSSEDSTMDSWSSCQENFDSETEESNSLAAQVKGSPKLRSFIRTKRKELREKTWKKNSRKNHSSSTESIDSEGIKQAQNRQSENYDPEFNSQYILLEPGDDEVPHRILRESSSTSNLERHFSGRGERDLIRNTFRLEKKVSEESSVGVDAPLLTPPPSPDLERKNQQDVSSRLVFAQTDLEEVDFVEVDYMKDLNLEEKYRSVKNINGIMVEVLTPGFEVPLDSAEDYVITCAEVLQDTPQDTPRQTKKEVPVHEDIETSEDDDILKTRSKMRRCSSLKSWKTPPGTPGGKKIVRFADALGLDLADVRTFLDEIPKIPSSAYDDLHFDLPKYENVSPPPPKTTLIPLFQQPGAKFDFLDRVQNQKICLESALVSDEGVLMITGFIRVQNMSFHKSVHVRYTLNGWETFSDLQATYVPHSCDGFSDRFSFIIYGHTLKIGQKLEFALRLECCGAQYWDNNGGVNYVLNCLPQSSSNSIFSSLSNSQVDPWFDFY